MTSYDINRENIENGDLFFTANPALFSRIIRFFTHSKVSHVGIFVWCEGRLLICEAMEGKGVVITPASKRIEEETKCWWGRVNHGKTEKEIKKECFDRLGDGYDMKGALLSKILPNDNLNFFCSELVEKILYLKSEATNRGTTPDDIARLCTKHFYRIK